MISERALAEQCTPRTLARARTIAASERNILTKQVRYDADETILSAFVASSSGWDDRYRSSATIDEDADAVVDYACTCPAFRAYDGMCKHAAALVLAYNTAPEKFLGYCARRESTTSAPLAELMRRADELARDENAEGSIDLEPTLTYAYGEWSVRFRVAGPEGSYVVKNISDFTARMRAGERYAYGKNLAFAHVPALLTAQAQRLAEFLDRAVSLRETAAGTSWRARGAGDVGRDLPLSEAEAIELLDALDANGRPFTVEGGDAGVRAVTHAHVVEADPQLNVALRASERGGYYLEADAPAAIAAQGRRLYVWQGDTFYRCTPGFAANAGLLRSLYGSDEERLYVAGADMPLFCATVLPTLEQWLRVDAPAAVDAFRPVPCTIEFYFDRDDEGVHGRADAVYGSRRYDAGSYRRDGGDPAGPLRAKRQEDRARALMQRYFGPGAVRGTATIDAHDDEQIANLVLGGLTTFRAAGSVFTTPAFDRLIRDGKPRITMGVSLAGNLINLTVQADDLPARELSALLASYRKRKRYHRLRTGAFVDLEQFDLSQLDRLAADLGISSHDLAHGNVQLPSFRAFYLDEEQNLERDRSFTRYLEDFKRTDERAYDVPPELTGTLRPYQAEGFRWLSARCDAGFGGILADEMGLGKSLQLIALLLARRDEARTTGPSLVVCPASLVYNWTAEFARFAPDLDVRAVAGTKRERALARAAAFGDEPADVIVTSYDLLRIDVADYAAREFWLCALDEAQYIKNPATLTTRATKRVQAQHRFALTGTPMENRLSELWSIFDFLMPGLLGPYARFRERFEQPIVGGDEAVAARLQAAVGPFLLRRLKTDVLRELPDKLEAVVYAPLIGEQRRLYDAHEQHLREALTVAHRDRKKTDEHGNRTSKVEVLAELTRLRQLCCDPRLLYEDYRGPAAKLGAIADLVDAARDAGEKALVFSQFTSFLSVIAERLDRMEVPYFTITGATPKRERVELVERFNGDDTPVFLVSLKAGGTGLNLTGASVVIHADPWWNAAAQNQATDRAHRIGQTRVVSVQKVIAKGTIEERIVRLQEAKSELANQVVGASGVSLATLSEAELLELLEG